MDKIKKRKRGRPPLSPEEKERRREARALARKNKKSKRGRPSKFNADVVDKLVYAITIGAPRSWAAEALDIGESTVREWLRRGKNGEEGFAEFYEQMKLAQFSAPVRYHETIHKAIENGDWHAAKWMLQHKLPDHYGNKLAIDQTVRGGMPELDVSKYSDEELDALRGLLEKGATEQG